jgi:hypothetical protein
MLKLHLEQQLHGNAESFFEAERHFGRKAGLAVEHCAQRRAAHTEDFRRTRDRNPLSGKHIVLGDFAGMGDQATSFS